VDHIDRSIEAWRRERPDVDVSAVGRRAPALSLRHLGDDALADPLAKHGLQPGWFDLLAALRHAGTRGGEHRRP